MPLAAAPTEMRKASSVSMASLKPADTSPITASPGTRQPEKTRRPMGWGMDIGIAASARPGVPCSTRKAVMPLRPSAGSTVAKTT